MSEVCQTYKDTQKTLCVFSVRKPEEMHKVINLKFDKSIDILSLALKITTIE